MKSLAACAFLAAQILPLGHAAAAAELAEHRTQQMGAFAGLRVRMPLDVSAQQRRIRAGLALAPTLHSRTATGETRLRIGEGVELGIVGRERVRLSLAGTPVNRLAQGGTGPSGQRLGISPIGWVAIGVGVAVVAAGTWFVIVMNDESRCCE
jgi:hypothetical protein